MAAILRCSFSMFSRHDKLAWDLKPTRAFTVRLAYRLAYRLQSQRRRWYPRCGIDEESIKHLLFLCPHSIHVWKISLLRLDFASVPPSSFSTRWLHLVRKWKDLDGVLDGLGLVAYFCWGIWKARNKFVFEEVKWDARQVALMACLQFWEFKTASSSSSDCLFPGLSDSRFFSYSSFFSTRWLPPGEGVLKCNVDASFLASSWIGGGVAVFHDYLGTIVQAVVFSPFPAASVTLAEAICLHKAILWAGSCSVSQVSFECDSKVVVQAVMGDAPRLTELHYIAFDIQVALQRFSFSRLSHFNRNGNAVAHAIAKLSRDFLPHDLALVYFPEDILELAVKDCLSC
ncbi:uncharacterized protein LOC132295720 [Cornus florida]|uniref:uncharacterized protein LOC132295720 n=1 Tax=Cornus florida TaxID=4283 RepID=UPI00289F2886|nr:uncharacterized protein LOC132295720 [Cornus florida]